MEQITLQDLREFYETFAELPDDRPKWMKEFNDNPPEGYYHFLYQFQRRFVPDTTWEIGIGRGGGAAHLALGNPGGLVITVDVNPTSKIRVEKMSFPNVVPILSDSVDILSRIQWIPKIDVLFVDGAHEGPQAYREYVSYRPHVRDGGIIFFDDIRINGGMNRMWESLPDPKVEMNSLHSESGFGVAIKDPEISPKSLDEVFRPLRRIS